MPQNRNPRVFFILPDELAYPLAAGRLEDYFKDFLSRQGVEADVSWYYEDDSPEHGVRVDIPGLPHDEWHQLLNFMLAIVREVYGGVRLEYGE